MKLKMFQVRFLYENINRRKLKELLLASRVSECLTEEHMAIGLTLVQKILSEFNKRIITKSLPCETLFFTQKDYNSTKLESDRKKYLQINPQAKSIMTILEYEGFLGSPTLNYICRRLMCMPIKEDDKELELSYEVILADANLLLSEEQSQEQVESSISKQIVERQRMIQMLLDSQNLQNKQIVEHAGKIEKELVAKRNELDIKYVSELNKFTAKVTDFLAKDEKKIRALLDTFKYDIEYEKILEKLNNHSIYIENYIKEIQQLSKSNIDKVILKIEELNNNLNVEKITEDSMLNLNSLLSSVKFKIERLKISTKNNDKYLEQIDDLNINIEGLISETEAISTKIQKISPQLRKSIKQTSYFVNDSKNKLDNIEKSINDNLGIMVSNNEDDDSVYYS